MEFQLFGPREVAMFDLWSIEHLLLGVVLTRALQWYGVQRLWRVVAVLLVSICLWEAVELAMELGYFGDAVSAWKRGHEHWTNRYVSDILLVLIGGVLQHRWLYVWRWISLPFVVWGITNYTSPTSMSVQEYLLQLPLGRLAFAVLFGVGLFAVSGTALQMYATTSGLLWRLVQTGRIRGTVFTAIFTAVSYRLAGGAPAVSTVVLSAVAMALIHMSIMSFNDWCDRRHDLHKGRRLAVDHSEAFRSYVALLCSTTVLGISCIGVLNPMLGAYLGLVLLIGLGYSAVERVFLLNNFLVGVCGAAPVLVGAVAMQQVSQTTWWWYTVFFLLILGREAIKDVEDEKLDLLYSHKRTIATQWGSRTSALVASVLTSIAGAVLYLAKLAKWASALVVVLVYRLVRLDPTSINSRHILVYDTVLGVLLLHVVFVTA